MSLVLEHLGLRYVPFTHGGVPEVEKKSRPVGLERELKELIDAVNLVLSQRLNENLVIVVIGEYGWGKTELLDYFTKVVESKYGDKVEIARVPLTFSLSTRHIINVLKKRSTSRPLILIIDEADELTRAIALRELTGDGRDVEKAIVELSTTIRALVEPRQYYKVLNIELEKLRNILVVVALTPQTYYGILKNAVPDIFDISIGRVYKEIALPSGISFWVADGIVQEKLRAASTQRRLREIRRGALDPRHPLSLEYVASLYYILYIAERGPPSPRTFVKYVAKLFDEILKCSGKLTPETYIRFLKDVSNELLVAKEILQKVEDVGKMYENEGLAKLHILLELIPIPVTRDFLINQLGSEAETWLRALEKINIVKKVYVLKTSLDKLSAVNELREKLGLAPIGKDELDSTAIVLDEYYLEYRDGLAVLNVVFPTVDSLIQSLGEIVEAYIPASRTVLSATSDSSESKIRQCIRMAYEKISKPQEAARLLAEALVGKPRMVHKLRENALAISCSTDTLELRQCVLFFHVQSPDELKQVENVVNDAILNACVRIGSDDILYDVLHVVLYAQNMRIPKDFVEKILQGEWKIPGLPRKDFLNVLIVDAETIDRFRKALAGYLILRHVENGKVPDKYVHLLRTYEDVKARIASFLTRARERVLKELCIGVRRSRESKTSILRELVLQWISCTVAADLPDVFKSSDGKPCISRPEQYLHRYLLDRGIDQVSQRELERIIRRLFPVHLWRELREKDLIELCKLRALLLPTDKYLRVYTPEAARDFLMSKLRELKVQLSRAKAELEITIGGKVSRKIVLQIVPTELEHVIRTLEQRLVREVIDLAMNEDSLRKVARIMLELEEVRNRVASALASGDATLHRLREIVRNLNTAYGGVLERLNVLARDLPRLAEWFRKKLDSEISVLASALNVEEALSLDYVSEILSKVADKIVEIQLEVDKVLSTLSELMKLEQEASRIMSSIEKEIKRALQDIDRKVSQSRDPVTVALKYLQSFLAQVRAKVSDRLTAVYRELERLSHLRDTLCKTGLLRGSDICERELSLDNVEDLKSIVYSKLDEIGRQVRFSTEKLIELVLSLTTPKDINELSHVLKVDKDSLIKVLEKLHEMGIVRKLYCI